MARRTQILFIDDIGGSQADGTVRFGLDGMAYESEVNKNRADKLGEDVGPCIDAARKVRASRRSPHSGPPGGQNRSEVRGWARARGLKVSDRGRIPADLLAR